MESDDKHEWFGSGWFRNKRCKKCMKNLREWKFDPTCRKKGYYTREACLSGGQPIGYCQKYIGIDFRDPRS